MKIEILPLKGYEGIYEISNRGRIRKLSNGSFLKPRLVGKNGRRKIPTVDLIDSKGRRLQLSLPRLVAQHFIKNPDECICIHHKDGNIFNCNAWNICWIPNDVVNWLGTQKKGKAILKGMPKKIGTKKEAISFIENLKNAKQGEQYLLDFYITGDESFLWEIFELHKSKMKARTMKLVSDDTVRHDLLIDSFLYFIDLAKRYSIYNYTYKKWIDCLGLEVKNYYKDSYKYTRFDEDYGFETDGGNYQTHN